MTVLVLAAVALFAAPAAADVVTLTNGAELVGILDSDKDGERLLYVSADGFVVLDTATVAGVRREGKAANARHAERWRAEEKAAAARTAKAREFAAAQRAKGLMDYDGEWVTAAEYDRRLERLRAAAPPAVTVVRTVVVAAPEPVTPVLVPAFVSYESVRRMRRAEFSRWGSGRYTVPLPLPGVRTFGISPISGRYSPPPTLFDRGAGMGPGAHYDW